MLIEIDDNKTISEIQERFSLCFPYLKVEFYDESHHWKESSPSQNSIDPGTTVGAIRKIHNPGIIEIKSWQKTGEVEQLFQKLFGLNAQIFRLEGKEWKQSTESDNLTLAMQTKIAMKTKA